MDFHKHTFVKNISLNVEQLDQSLFFYVDTLGLKVLSRTETTVVLTANGKTPLIELVQPADITPKESRTTGLYHFALLFPNRQDLATLLRHLMSIEYPLQGAADHEVSEALYLADPDGNGIEFYVDRPSSKWNWSNGQVEMGTVRLDIDGLLAVGKGEWSGIPSDTIMGHIHLHVGDLEASERFYVDCLGFDIVHRYGKQALFLSAKGYHHHIGLNTWNGVGAPPPSENSVGMRWYSIVTEDEELRKMVDRLYKEGINVLERDNSFVVHDPSNNKIYLQKK